MNRRELKPRKKDHYSLAWEYVRRNPTIIILIIMVLVLLFSIVFFWISVETAHMAGVASYGG